MRIKGELFNGKFYENSRESRMEQISSNKISKPELSRSSKEFESTKRRLNRANSKRIEEIERKYRYSRIQAKKKYENIYDSQFDISIDDNNNRSV